MKQVKTGDVLCIIEAMKMENALRAERDGIVTRVHAKAGDVVAVDALIMEFAFDQGALKCVRAGALQRLLTRRGRRA